MILDGDPWGWRQDNHLAGGVPPLRRGPPLAGRWGAFKGPLRPAFKNITCQETPFLALPSLGCQVGPFHGVLWIRSVCSSEEAWSHSVGSRPQPEALLPPKAARSRRKREELPALGLWARLHPKCCRCLFTHLSPFYRSGNWGSLGLCTLPKAIQRMELQEQGSEPTSPWLQSRRA